jgi:hypothetical protein
MTLEPRPSPYQVIVEFYYSSAWYGPNENAENAHHRYGVQCARLNDGNVSKVVLTKHGIVVAVAIANDPPTMTIDEALQIIVNLCRQLTLDKRQEEAVSMIEDLAVNEYGDD